MKNEKKIEFLNGDLILSYSEIKNDYRLAARSRFASVLGRKEVLTGKASFGIFGDGVELPQVVLSKFWQKGDFRTGYYRDQTLELASGNLTVQQFFSQLYAHPCPEKEPSSAGRQMNCHFATRFLDEAGHFKNLLTEKNTAADISPTAGQMARLLGLAYASKLYRNNKSLWDYQAGLSDRGNEVVFGSIGDASTSEGVFFETMNAAGVLQVPLVMSVWDNGYGISVPRKLQTVNDSISRALSGFASDAAGEGFSLYQAPAWDYRKLCEVYMQATEKTRREHKPALVHITDVTQPQGHSTSGSHERYKSQDRLAWEKQYCCLQKFRQWMIAEKIATVEELDTIDQEEKKGVELAKKEAWQCFLSPIQAKQTEALRLLRAIQETDTTQSQIQALIDSLEQPVALHRRVVQNTVFKALIATYKTSSPAKQSLRDFYNGLLAEGKDLYETKMYSESMESPLHAPIVFPVYDAKPEMVDGRVILQRCFDAHFARDPRLFVIGEDVGKLGDVNLVFEGLNAKYGDLRVTDTGIREATILGQGIGAALRGLRPIVDIQYLDYFMYALQVASDDLATLHYRTAGGQKAPVIIRTKGHRLEGIWHTGSPLSVLLGSLRGIYLCVPRNMTQAAGFYNTLLRGDNPALVIEALNAYRLKEPCPNNVGDFTIPLGHPEILRAGDDLTLVTYGACCSIALAAGEELEKTGISVEVIDVQTLIPFDTEGLIARSLEKTGAVLFLDEDVPGGGTAYMMQQVLERQKAFHFLDSLPRTVSAVENRCAYGRDGDYFCKPQVENIMEVALAVMRERNPEKYPVF